jgi:hypothetical protein
MDTSQQAAVIPRNKVTNCTACAMRSSNTKRRLKRGSIES